MDAATIRDLWAGPGSDTRQWLSIAYVDPSTPDAPNVRFNDENGAPLETGPLVNVTLQPSGISVSCRLSNQVAGLGEAEYYPWADKDEVLVAIPEGSEMAGPVIIARMNQGIDKFPATVAGQDATQNKFGFRRMRAPYIVETASAYLIRHATTGAQIGIDNQGQVVIADADKNRIFFSPDVIELSSGDNTTFVQVQVTQQTIAMQGGSATLSLASDTVLFVPGTLNIGSGGASGTGHAITAEQVVLMFLNYTCAMVAASAFAPGYVGSFNSSIPAPLNAVVSALAAGGAPGPCGPTPGGNVSQMAAAWASFVNAIPAGGPLSAADVTGLTPGIGRGALLL